MAIPKFFQHPTPSGYSTFFSSLLLSFTDHIVTLFTHWRLDPLSYPPFLLPFILRNDRTLSVSIPHFHFFFFASLHDSYPWPPCRTILLKSTVKIHSLTQTYILSYRHPDCNISMTTLRTLKDPTIWLIYHCWDAFTCFVTPFTIHGPPSFYSLVHSNLTSLSCS